MSNLINEITRMKSLMKIREEEDVTQYLDSTYLKTGEQANITDEENHNVVTTTIQEAIDNNLESDKEFDKLMDDLEADEDNLDDSEEIAIPWEEKYDDNAKEKKSKK